MRLEKIIFGLLVLLCIHSAPGLAGEHLHHALQVTLKSAENALFAEDTIILPAGMPDTVRFRLHSNLEASSRTSGVTLEKLGKDDFLTVYQVRLPAGRRQFTMAYKGRIHHALQSPPASYGRGTQQTAGQISEAGVYLTGGSGWYPDFNQKLLTFALQVSLPENWRAVSQGARVRKNTGTVAWRMDAAQEQIFLIAGRFTEYTRKAGPVTGMVFLRRPEADLAERYLVATRAYINMYEELIGPYPYTKFALVENFWETGFGMPSFTLMGPRVIRFPFIIHSSYPHEILHNWWGNSVYPVYASGNWAEGLTAYLSDHLLRMQRGRAAAYRQTVLQEYRDYVSSAKDFALTAFTARHNPATEAIGYGKGMMFFHMLRYKLGGPVFQEALQAFYRRYRFTYTDFDDIRRVFESVSGADLSLDFKQWVTRAGAPQLAIQQADIRAEKDGYAVTMTLRQNQQDPPYVLTVPVAVTLEGKKAAEEIDLVMNLREQHYRLTFASRPLRLDIDPRYDLFRRLARGEIPPALSQILASENLVAVLPANASGKRQKGYRGFAESLGRSGPEKMRIVFDDELETLPGNRNVVLLGWDNRFRDQAAGAVAPYGSRLTSGSATLAGRTVARAGNTVVIATRHPQNQERALVWVAADFPESLPGLARKLPHYHKYSYLAFKGREPENTIKGRWRVRNSPMTVFLGKEKPEMGELARRAPLISRPPVFNDMQ